MLSSLLANLWNECNFILSNDGFEIKPIAKYYRFIDPFLFVSRVVILQDVFVRNMFYFVFCQIVV